VHPGPKLVALVFAAMLLPTSALNAKVGFEGPPPSPDEPLDVHADREAVAPDQPTTSEASSPNNISGAERRGPRVAPLLSAPASAPQVRRLVGSVRYRIDRCQTPGYFNNVDERIVQVTVNRVPNGGLSIHDGLLDALLLNAARFAWRECPQPYVRVDRSPTGDFHYDVGLIQINGPAGEALASAKLGGEPLTLYGDQALNSSPRGYQWRDYRNLAAENEAAGARASQQQQIAADRYEQRQTSMEQGRRNQSRFFNQLLFFAFLGLLIWLFAKRDDIVRWFYSLQPHPARGLVDAAIFQGVPIDGALYQQIIDQTGGSRIENQVRTLQAKELTTQLRSHEAALRAESQKQLRAERERVERENAFTRAHLELLRAGVSHEDAAARLDELRRSVRHDR
jgi:hypothetical protein